MLQLLEEHIALAFRIPLAVLGLGKTPVSSTEALMGMWLASGLGSALRPLFEQFNDEAVGPAADAAVTAALKDVARG